MINFVTDNHLRNLDLFLTGSAIRSIIYSCSWFNVYSGHERTLKYIFAVSVVPSDVVVTKANTKTNTESISLSVLTLYNTERLIRQL